MVRSNYAIADNHFRKHWQRIGVKTWFNQPARKQRRLNARKERAAGLFPRPVESLRPVVRSTTNKHNKRQRVGRGFTLAELKAAGIGAAFARTVGITIDHRRKNRSVDALQANANRLKAYREKLVVFPRRAGKTKKGDTPADQLNGFNAQQNTDRVCVAVPEPKLREKAITITKDLKERKVYKELRQEWSNAYYQGAKLKKAKAAEGKN